VDQSVYLRFLSEADMIKAGVLDMEGCLETMEDMFEVMTSGDYLMGGPSENDHGHLIWFPEEKRGENMPVAGPDRRFCSMIAYLGGKYNIAGQKWYGSNIENRHLGLPRSIHSITLNDPDNIKPLAFMSGNLLSQMRTGAIPGIASKYLAKENPESLGLVGAGMVGKTSLLGVATAHKNLKKIVVYDVFESASESLVKYAKDELGLHVETTNDVNEVIEEMDIIVVCASGDELPTIDTNLIKKGGFICLTSAPNFNDESWINEFEFYADNWKSHKVFVDEMNLPRENVEEEVLAWVPSAPVVKAFKEKKFEESRVTDLGDVIVGNKQGRKNPDEKVIFITTGLPVEDVAWGKVILDRANEENIGQKLNFWEDAQYWLK